MAPKAKAATPPPAPLDMLQRHINTKAEAQARQEWNELELLMENWSTQCPAGYAQLRQNSPSHYGTGRRLPDVRLTAFPYQTTLDAALVSFNSIWMSERIKVIAEHMTKEMVAKLAALPA